MAPGQPVTWHRTAYTVVRSGCATGWEECPHGEHAVTVVRDGKTLTECVDGRVLP